MSASPPVTETDSLWLAVFKHPRRFDRESENGAYVNYLDVVSLESEEEDESEDDVDGYTGADDDETDALADVDNGNELVEEPDNLDAPAEELDNEGASLDCARPCRLQSAVWRLRKDLPGTEEKTVRRHPSRIDGVTVFVEHRLASQTDSKPGRNDTLVGLVDRPLDNSQSLGQTNDSRYRGGLSDGKLLETLQVPVRVFPLSLDPVLTQETEIHQDFEYNSYRF